jgi:hypothetical protein
LTVWDEAQAVFEGYNKPMLKMQLHGIVAVVPSVATIVSQFNQNIDASETRIVVAAGSVTLANKIYAKNLSPSC